MSKNSKLRIFFSCLVVAVGLYLLLPGRDSWIKMGGVCLVVLALMALVVWAICKDTIDWSEKTKRLIAIYWDMDNDVLWVMRRTDENVVYRQDVRCNFVDVYEQREGEKHGFRCLMMDAVPFLRSTATIVMNEGGYMILKQGEIRLKIQHSNVVENFFAA